MNDVEARKIVVFVMAGLFALAGRISVRPPLGESAFDEAEDFVAESEKRGINFVALTRKA